MAELTIDIEDMFFTDRLTPEVIAKELNVPLEVVQDYLAQFDEEIWDDSMDGDAESALASAGWGTDEDYGGGNEYL
jgi:hypothetical protein